MQFFLRKHAFSLLILAVIGLAVAFPEPASEGGFLHGDWLNRLGVAAIFFLQGVSLPTRSLFAGYKPLKVHGFVIIWNFVGFPATVFLVLYPIASYLPAESLLGFGLLAFLPTTIASATAYTAVSDGNVANAIVSTVLSNLLAVLIVPVVSVIYFRWELAVDVPLGRVLLSLVYMLLFPLALGQVFQKWVGLNADAFAKVARSVSFGIILFIVYIAFAKSMNSGFFEQHALGSLAITLFAVVFLLLVANALVWMSTFSLKLDAAQRIAAFYCASQKSLATGFPLASSILLTVPDVEHTATIFIPLFCFHPLQMLLAGMIAAQLKQNYHSITG